VLNVVKIFLPGIFLPVVFLEALFSVVYFLSPHTTLSFPHWTFVERRQRSLDGLFRKAFKRGLCSIILYWWPYASGAWCWYQIISPGVRPKTLSVPTAAQTKTQKNLSSLRCSGHSYTLPHIEFSLYKNSFV